MAGWANTLVSATSVVGALRSVVEWVTGSRPGGHGIGPGASGTQPGSPSLTGMSGLGAPVPALDDGAKHWNEATMDGLLADQRWSDIVGHLYTVLDVHRCESAADWVERDVLTSNAHVPLLYLHLRNGVKQVGDRVLNSKEFARWVRVWLVLAVRVVEDGQTCVMLMGMHRGQLAVLRRLVDKTLGWLRAKRPLDKWPAVDAVVAGFKGLDAADRPPPGWVPSFSMATVGQSVYFQTPSPEAQTACRHNVSHIAATQASVREGLLDELGGAECWDAAFRALCRRLE